MNGYPARVSIQSRECSPGLLERLSGSALFPERPAGSVIVTTVCRDGGTVLYVTAPEMADAGEQVDYYLGLLPAAEPGEAASRRSRVQILSLADDSPRWLSEKILDSTSPAGAAAREAIHSFVRQERRNGADVRLSYFEPSANLERMARELGIPGDQVASRHIPLSTKASGRQLFRSAGIGIPAGSEECHTVPELAGAVATLARQGHRKVLLKLSSTEYAAGLGNARLDLTGMCLTSGREELISDILDRLPHADLVDGKIGWAQFAAAFPRSGVIAEELVASEQLRSPSFQGRIGADGTVQAVSAHDQILGGGHTYVGSSFPAAASYRATIIDYGCRIGRVLAERGVRDGDYGADFIAVPGTHGWRVLGCELNLRATGTKHGFVMATSLLGVRPGEDGRLVTGGTERVYEASDGISDPRYLGLRPGQLIRAVQGSGLRYNHDRKTGVVLHMLSAVPRFGKFGAVCIGTDRAHASGLMRDLRELIGELAGQAHGDSGQPDRPGTIRA
jgi:PGM1 C-terminal domain